MHLQSRWLAQHLRPPGLQAPRCPAYHACSYSGIPAILRRHAPHHAQSSPAPLPFPRSAGPLILHRVRSYSSHQSNRSTNTWIVPPQDSPIFSKFSSSLMPNSSICGFPVLITSIAECTTAGSTQPPLTEPDNSPPSLTASFAPGLRGAEPYIVTTVATATRSPRSRHRSTSGRISRIESLLLYPRLTPFGHSLTLCSCAPHGPAIVDFP